MPNGFARYIYNVFLTNSALRDATEEEEEEDKNVTNVHI